MALTGCQPGLIPGAAGKHKFVGLKAAKDMGWTHRGTGESSDTQIEMMILKAFSTCFNVYA